MAVTVINTEHPVEMIIFIVRAFVNLRILIASHRELARRVEALEKSIAYHDKKILSLVKAIKQLISPAPLPKKRQIGFKPTRKK